MKKYQTIFFLVLLAVSSLLTLAIFRPYLELLSIGAIMAIFCYPLFTWLQRLLRSEVAAALLTVIIVCAVVVIPLALFVVSLYFEANSLVAGVSGQFAGGQISEIAYRYLPPDLISGLTSFFTDSQAVLKNIAGYISSNLPKLFANFFSAMFGFVVVMFSTYYFIKDGHRIRQSIIDISPLGTDDDESVINKVVLAVSAVINGIITVAVLKAILSALFYWVFGLPSPFFWGAMTGFASLLPVVGIGIITIPACIYLFAIGHVGAGIGLIVVSVGLIGAVDNFIQPKLVESRTKIHPLLVLISVLGGLSFFGFSGLVLGPLVLAITMALIDIYRREFSFISNVPDDDEVESN